MNVIWTSNARIKLQSIQEFISENNPKNARRWVAETIEKTKSLETHPYLGRVFSRFHHEYVRELLVKSYRIIYRIDETSSSIFILTIANYREDVDRMEI